MGRVPTPKTPKATAPEFVVYIDKNELQGQQQPKGDRFIYLLGEVNLDMAREIICCLLEYQRQDPLKEITFVIDSFGGEVDSMFAITDVMNMIACPIRTICVGCAMSAASFIFINGAKGKRFMSKHSRLMFHQMSGLHAGTVTDITIDTDEIKFLQNQFIEEIISKSSLSPLEVKKLIDRNTYLRPDKAIEMGLCDGILEKLF